LLLKHIDFNNDWMIDLDTMSKNNENKNIKIMVFRPNIEEFKNFGQYIQSIESKGAHKAGVAKVCNHNNQVFFIKISDFLLQFKYCFLNM